MLGGAENCIISDAHDALDVFVAGRCAQEPLPQILESQAPAVSCFINFGERDLRQWRRIGLTSNIMKIYSPLMLFVQHPDFSIHRFDAG
jgi:hypothetical protein